MFSFSRENTSLAARWWRNVDKQILFLFIFLLFLGLFFSFSSTTSVMSEKMDKETYFFFIKHLIFVIFSLLLLIGISIQEKNKLIKFLTYVFYISIFFLFLTLLIGVEVKGSKRWIDIPLLPMRFQPVELVKPLFIILIAKILILNKKNNLKIRYLNSFLILIFILTILINQPDLGQSLLLILSWLIMIFVSGFNMITLFILGVAFLAIIFFSIFIFPEKFGYILYRIRAFFDPNSGDNFQSQKALDAIKQGGLTGQGMGEGILKDKVPEAHTDYIIAVISEEFGAIFVLLIILIFLFISLKVLKNDRLLRSGKVTKLLEKNFMGLTP